MTTQDFDQDIGRAKQAAEHGPVYITDRGRPTHVFLTYEAHEQLLGPQHALDQLAEPAGIEDVELEVPKSRDAARPPTVG